MNKDKNTGKSKVGLVNIELTGSSLAYLIFVQIRKRHLAEQTHPKYVQLDKNTGFIPAPLPICFCAIQRLYNHLQQLWVNSPI